MRSLIFSLLILSLGVFSNATAALDLELTQGVQGAFPIAVVPFGGQANNSADPNNIAAVVSNDLAHSGRFKVADSTQLQQQPHNSQAVDPTYWQEQKLDDVVVGTVKPAGNGQVQVAFQLVNIFGNKADANAASNPVLLDENFTVNPDQLRALAHHISDLIYQQLTGDRGVFSTKIAYVLVQHPAPGESKNILEVADQDGYNPRALLTSMQPIMSPAWSPDGKSLAYVSFESNHAAIYIQNVATGSRRLLTSFPGINGAPAWSPDSRKLAIVLTKTGYPKIYLMDLGSGQLTQLTDGYAIDTEPHFSPDGQSIIFTSNRGGGPEIYQMNLASHQIQRLTFNSPYNASASFTPNGANIVMLTQINNGFNIAIQNLSSGRVQVLTDSGWAQSPSVAPNGKMVVYANQVNGVGILGMVAADGSIKLRIPSNNGDVQEPAWSPFLD